MPAWKEFSVKGIAYRTHLYTQIVSGVECDDLEKWFDEEFETPAEDAIRKVVSNTRMRGSDWERLVRYLALHDVRNPVRYPQHKERLEGMLPSLLEDTLRNAVGELEKAGGSIEPRTLATNGMPATPYPMRVTAERVPGKEFGALKAETAIGRSTWLYHFPRLLTETANILHEHKWTIIRPAEGLHWFTSDNPVIRLNFNSIDKYDFKGGWGSKGTELMLPLGPEHLMYCQIGNRPPQRGTRFDAQKTHLIRRLIAEHAHRLIFSQKADPSVESLRPRLVDASAVSDEKDQWNRWHEEQSESERQLSSQNRNS